MNMKKFYLGILLLLGAGGTYQKAAADTYPEVVFDNSLVEGIYAKSKVRYQGASWVENLNRHLLVSDTLFFTPGNALSLRYQSAREGMWKVDLEYNRQKLNYQLNRSDFLLLKVYIKSKHTQKANLPKISIRQRGKETDQLNLGDYIQDFQHQAWVDVRIPLEDFKNLYTNTSISSIRLTQNEADKQLHELFIDQVEFTPKHTSNIKLSSPAILSEAKAYDTQVRLRWQLPLTPSIRYIKIYRSTDNKNFEPIGIRSIAMQGCLDHVPTVDKTYYYKIAWVDYNYEESPFSPVKEVKTRALKGEELLDLVQEAHINYFAENYDINSGMYLPFRLKERAVISIKESGNAILSLLVGVERKMVNRQLVLGRMARMVKFLAKAQNQWGIFPAYFDGRSGLPEHRNGDASYDVLATSSIMEALLVARQYFSADQPAEVELREGITKLWENIQWDKLLAEGYDDVLVEKLSLSDSTLRYKTLGGINESMGAYFLAMSSPAHSIPTSAYENGVKYIDNDYASAYNKMDSLARDTVYRFMKNFRLALNPFQDEPVALDNRHAILQDTVLYGEHLPFGFSASSLLDLYRPFFTIDPKVLRDMDYAQAIKSYIRVRKRRDNEIGVGSTNSDIWGFYQRVDSVGSYRINPAIAPSAICLMPEEGKRAIEALYTNYGENLFTEYGFRAWLDLRDNDVSDEYFAVNQASVAIAIENARSGLIWNLYREIPEIKALFTKLFDEDK